MPIQTIDLSRPQFRFRQDNIFANPFSSIVGDITNLGGELTRISEGRRQSEAASLWKQKEFDTEQSRWAEQQAAVAAAKEEARRRWEAEQGIVDPKSPYKDAADINRRRKMADTERAEYDKRYRVVTVRNPDGTTTTRTFDNSTGKYLEEGGSTGAPAKPGAAPGAALWKGQPIEDKGGFPTWTAAIGGGAAALGARALWKKFRSPKAAPGATGAPAGSPAAPGATPAPGAPAPKAAPPGAAPVASPPPATPAAPTATPAPTAAGKPSLWSRAATGAGARVSRVASMVNPTSAAVTLGTEMLGSRPESPENSPQYYDQTGRRRSWDEQIAFMAGNARNSGAERQRLMETQAEGGSAGYEAQAALDAMHNDILVDTQPETLLRRFVDESGKPIDPRQKVAPAVAARALLTALARTGASEGEIAAAQAEVDATMKTRGADAALLEMAKSLLGASAPAQR